MYNFYIRKVGEIMRYAKDFRRIARESLDGKWKISILVGLVAVLLGAVDGMGPEIKLNMGTAGTSVSLDFLGKTMLSTGGDMNSGLEGLLRIGQTYILIIGIIALIISLIIGSSVKVGYAKYNLNLNDNKEAQFENLFDYFRNWKTNITASLLKSLYTLLWTLLLIIPGIIASYSYAMTEYILADHPELYANEAIKKSKEMMDGNKWRLFCLEFSFIGWSFLASLTFGIGHLWLVPYKEAARAAFYRDISHTEVIMIEEQI